MSILQFSEAKQFLTRLVRLMEQQKANGFIGEVIGYVTFWWDYRMTSLNFSEVKL